MISKVRNGSTVRRIQLCYIENYHVMFIPNYFIIIMDIIES